MADALQSLDARIARRLAAQSAARRRIGRALCPRAWCDVPPSRGHDSWKSFGLLDCLARRAKPGAERPFDSAVALTGISPLVTLKGRVEDCSRARGRPHYWRAMLAGLRGIAAWTQGRRLRSYALPARALWGQEPPLFPASDSRLLADLNPGALLEPLPGSRALSTRPDRGGSHRRRALVVRAQSRLRPAGPEGALT